MDKYHIPQYLDEPLRLFLLTVGELIVFSVPFFLGLLVLNQVVLGITLGSVFVLLLKKAKGSQGHHFIRSLLYWYLPPLVMFRVMPPSYLRALRG
ncbi:MAG: hypothetical protein LEGION0398_MBIBDBAK_00179 [Legionellaceae bacterium]